MTTTDSYGLRKPESSDLYGDFIPEIFGEDMDILDLALQNIDQQFLFQQDSITNLFQSFGGMSLALITREQYDALETHSAVTLYNVTDGSKITQYLGDTELKSGTVTLGSAVPAASGVTSSAVGSAEATD